MKLVISPSKKGAACAALIIIHNNEQSAHETAKILHQFCSYNLVLLNNSSWTDRLITLPNPGCYWSKKEEKYVPNLHDPNSFFTEDVAKKYVQGEGPKQIKRDLNNAASKESRSAVREYTQLQFFQTVMRASNNFALPVIGLHNNTISDTKEYIDQIKKNPETPNKLRGKEVDKTLGEKAEDTGWSQIEGIIKNDLGSTALEDMNKKGRTNIYRWCFHNDLLKCHIGLPEDPDKVIWVTNESDFEKMKNKKLNVVLETPEKKGADSESKNDLSTLFVILKRLINQEMNKEVAEGKGRMARIAMDIDKLSEEIAALNVNTLSFEGALSLLKMKSKVAQLVEKVMQVAQTSSEIGLIRAGRENEMNNLRFINIETPKNRIKGQTEDGLEANYNYIKESLQSVGLFCCGTNAADIAKNDGKMKEKVRDLKKKKKKKKK